MTTVASAGAYLLSIPVELGPNAGGELLGKSVSFFPVSSTALFGQVGTEGSTILCPAVPLPVLPLEGHDETTKV
jgi:hypothetical protein